MNFHISSPWSPLRPQFSSSSLKANARIQPASSPSASHYHDPTGTIHDTVSSIRHPPHQNPATSPSSVTIEVDTVDTSDDDALNKNHRHNQAESGSDTEQESESDISADDVTQDSRDVLVQRLTDLAEKLSDGNVRTSSIEALHKQVDEMERVLRGGSSRARSVSRHSGASSRKTSGDMSSLRPSSSRPRSLQFARAAGNGGSRELSPGRDALGIMGATPMSPSWFATHFQRRPSTHLQEKDKAYIAAGVLSQTDVSASPRSNLDMSQPSNQQKEAPPPPPTKQQSQTQSTIRVSDTSTPSEITSEVAEVVMEAEKMCAEMATIIESLQSRRQESDHLHEILIHRKQLSHQRRLQQQQQQQEHLTQYSQYDQAEIEDLEEIMADNEAELRHLKVELRAIEAQCMGYVPKGADPELEESIQRWRQDWAALKDKFSSTRKRPAWRRGQAGRGRGRAENQGRRVVSLNSAALAPSGRDEEGDSNSSISALASPMSLR